MSLFKGCQNSPEKEEGQRATEGEHESELRLNHRAARYHGVQCHHIAPPHTPLRPHLHPMDTQTNRDIHDKESK